MFDSMILLNCPSVAGIEISFLDALEARHDHVIKTSQWGDGVPSISFSDWEMVRHEIAIWN